MNMQNDKIEVICVLTRSLSPQRVLCQGMTTIKLQFNRCMKKGTVGQIHVSTGDIIVVDCISSHSSLQLSAAIKSNKKKFQRCLFVSLKTLETVDSILHRYHISRKERQKRFRILISHCSPKIQYFNHKKFILSKQADMVQLGRRKRIRRDFFKSRNIE